MRAAFNLLLILISPLVRSGLLAAQIPPSARARQLVGCYALFTDGKALDTSYRNSSPRVLLDSTVFDMTVDSLLGPLRWTVLDRLDAQGRLLEARGPFPPFRWWVDSASDSLHLSFVNGSGGADLVLESTRASDTLRGRIQNNRDVGPPFGTNQQSALAVRVPCHSSAHP
jgi:hypothetical protein